MSFGVQSMVPHVLAALGRTPRSRQRRARPWPATREAGFETFNLDLIIRRRRRVGGRLGREPRRRARPRPAPHLAPTGSRSSPARPLAADPDRHPDDDDQADKYLLAESAPRRAGLRLVRDLELGPARARVPAQPPVLGRRRVPRRSGAPPTATAAVAAGGTCARPSGTSTRSRPGEPTEGGRGGRSTPRRRRLEALQLALRTDGRACRRRRWTSVIPPWRDWWTCDGDRAVLTPHGRLLANEVAVRLRVDVDVVVGGAGQPGGGSGGTSKT